MERQVPTERRATAGLPVTAWMHGPTYCGPSTLNRPNGGPSRAEPNRAGSSPADRNPSQAELAALTMGRTPPSSLPPPSHLLSSASHLPSSPPPLAFMHSCKHRALILHRWVHASVRAAGISTPGMRLAARSSAPPASEPGRLQNQESGPMFSTLLLGAVVVGVVGVVVVVTVAKSVALVGHHTHSLRGGNYRLVLLRIPRPTFPSMIRLDMDIWLATLAIDMSHQSRSSETDMM